MLNIQPHAPQSAPDPTENIHVVILRRPHARMRMFFCMICRTGLLQYQGNLVSVIPGDPDAEGEITRFPAIVRCSGNSEKYGRCPARYIIDGYVAAS